jgi:hypothetical protein
MLVKQFCTLSLLIFLAACQTSCSPQSSPDNLDATAVEPLPTVTITTTLFMPPLTPETVGTVQVESTASPTPILVSTAIPTATPTAIAVPETIIREVCPTTANVNVLPIWTQGSVLFSIGQMGLPQFPQTSLTIEEPNIWAIGHDNMEPQPVYQSFSNKLPPHEVHEVLSGSRISPDGTMIFDTVSGLGTNEAVLYDNRSDIVLRFPVPPSYGSVTWLSDGRVQYESIIERYEGEGETREVYIIDPKVQEIERLTVTLDLPDYTFNSYDIQRGMRSGYNSVDPTGELILYSATRNDSGGIETRLLNLVTSEVVWRHDAEYLPNYFAEWSKNGDHLLFEVGGIPASTSFQATSKLISLTRDGIYEELPSLFPGTEQMLITGVTRSPSGRYIFYSAFDYPVRITRGFIIDTWAREVSEICDPGTSFVTGFQGLVMVYWTQEDLLIYRVLIEKEEQPTHSLRILDIPNWTTQVLFEPEPGYGIHSYGWTPVDFP